MMPFCSIKTSRTKKIYTGCLEKTWQHLRGWKLLLLRQQNSDNNVKKYLKLQKKHYFKQNVNNEFLDQCLQEHFS